jgi:neurotransmitter:Na+ symporter, NSS family
VAEARWSGRLGFILATMGSAVGLGSIWKFPYEVGENGGGGFVLFYLAGLALVVAPLLLAELAIGRRGGGDAAASLGRLAREAGASSLWRRLGELMVAAGLLILAYYAAIGGLAGAYAWHALASGFGGLDAAGTRALFAATSGDPWHLGLWHLLFVAATAAILARGIAGGIEAACRVLMPLLILLMAALAMYAAFEGAFLGAAEFLLAPRFAAIDAGVALEALGLGFFSIGVGLGVVLTYAAHAGQAIRLGDVALATLAGDTLVSFLAGFAIFPLVFAQGLDPAAGTELMFLTLPIAFAALPFGDLVGAAFFAALAMAGLASAIALAELALAPLLRVTGWSRPRAALALGLLLWVIGLPAVLGFSVWAEARPLAFLPGFEAAGIVEAMDRVASNLLLPAAGLLLALFAGHVLPRAALAAELGLGDGALAALRFLLRWVVPGLIAAFVLLGHAGGE